MDETSGVFVRHDGHHSDYADGGESYVEEILAMSDHISSYPFNLQKHICDWPSEYHLSHQRINLLDAIEDLLHPGDSVLELGAGTGILTRWLAERCRCVDAVEGSLTRARIVALRNRQQDNVRVFVDDIQRIRAFGNKYNIVILTGVLEYAPIHGPRLQSWLACLHMLKQTRTALGPEGLLVLAIENRIGVKYWAGGREDHTGEIGEGIHGYPTPNSPVTWSRNELESLLRESGYLATQFYGLFPDYKLPTLFMRECDDLEGVLPHCWLHTYARDYPDQRQFTLCDPLVLETVSKAGLLKHFPNSFLVIASPSMKTQISVEWLIKKYVNHIAPHFHHTLTLTTGGDAAIIRQKPIYSGKAFHNSGSYAYQIKEEHAYIVGQPVYFDALRALFSRDVLEQLAQLFMDFRKKLLDSFGTAARDKEGYVMVRGIALDFTLWNVVRNTDRGMLHIGTKWSSRRDIPEDYIIYRNLYHLLEDAAPFMEATRSKQVIVEMLTRLYPTYQGQRMLEHSESESCFQRYVFGKNKSL